MIIISAMSRDRLIGKGDGLPWHVPEEYNQFLRFIEGQTVILGRKSYPIFGKSLTSAHNVVVSRSVSELPGAVVVPNIERAVEVAESFGKTVFSAGGSTIYQQTIPLADTMYLSFMKGEFEGDAYFPEFDESEWVVEKREDHPKFEFVVYRRAAYG
jgi:dihydrofolate reductase